MDIKSLLFGIFIGVVICMIRELSMIKQRTLEMLKMFYLGYENACNFTLRYLSCFPDIKQETLIDAYNDNITELHKKAEERKNIFKKR